MVVNIGARGSRHKQKAYHERRFSDLTRARHVQARPNAPFFKIQLRLQLDSSPTYGFLNTLSNIVHRGQDKK
jgi:hypothetical protein